MNVQCSLHPQYHDEVPLSKAPNSQLLPGSRSINGCPLLRVCVHGVCVHCCECALSMGSLLSTNSEYGSSYLAVCHVTFTFKALTHFVLSHKLKTKRNTLPYSDICICHFSFHIHFHIYRISIFGSKVMKYNSLY